MMVLVGYSRHLPRREVTYCLGIIFPVSILEVTCALYLPHSLLDTDSHQHCSWPVCVHLSQPLCCKKETPLLLLCPSSKPHSHIDVILPKENVLYSKPRSQIHLLRFKPYSPIEIMLPVTSAAFWDREKNMTLHQSCVLCSKPHFQITVILIEQCPAFQASLPVWRSKYAAHSKSNFQIRVVL